jgi:hypothetical protein
VQVVEVWMDLVAVGEVIHWTKERSTGSALLWMIGDGIEVTGTGTA